MRMKCDNSRDNNCEADRELMNSNGDTIVDIDSDLNRTEQLQLELDLKLSAVERCNEKEIRT